MVDHVCPWWGGIFIDNPLRRLLHPPTKILGEFVMPGMTVLDFGCGMGGFSIGMADLVGDAGTVIAADLQPQMLRSVEKRAKRAGLAERIRTHVCQRESMGIDQAVDFALAFWSAHEVPDVRCLLSEIHACLVPSGAMLIVEPRGHVSGEKFQKMVDIAADVGLHVQGDRRVRLSRSAVLIKG